MTDCVQCIFVVVEQFCHKPLSSFHVFLDSSKLRHCLRRKLADEKKALFQEIQKYNCLVQASATNIDAAMVEHSLTGEHCVPNMAMGGSWQRYVSFKCFIRI